MTYRPRTVLDEVGARDFKPSGMTGATAASRYVGATASGAPASGTFAVGDFVVDQTGKAWVCTVAGTPGTWTQLAGGSSTLAADTDVSLSSPVGGQVLGYSSALSKWVNQNQAGVAATTSTAQLGSNVSLTTTGWFTGPSITLSPGTWMISGQVWYGNTASGNANCDMRLYDGTTTYRESAFFASTSQNMIVPLTPIVITISSSLTLSLQIEASVSGGTIYASDGGFNSSYLTAVQLSGNPVGQQAPAVRAYNSANISIANSTLTALTFDSNRLDQGTSTPQHSTSSNTGRLVCQQAGTYQIGATIEWAASAGGAIRQIYLRVNGTTYVAKNNQTPVNVAYGTNQSVSAEWNLNVGDYVETVVYQDSGGALNIVQNGSPYDYSPEFWMARIDSGPGAVQPNTKVQLDYAASTGSELANPVVVSATTWTDICANQTFTVDDTNSVIEIQVDGGCWTTGYASASPNVSTRVMIDSAGTPLTKMLAGEVLHQNTWGIWPVSGQISLTGLSAGSHTVKVQAYASNGSMNFYCRTNSQPNTDFLNIRVLERKQSTSPPSSTPAPAVRCYNSAGLAVSSSSVTTLTFNTNRLDQGTSVAQHSTSTNTSRMVCQQAGVYQITGNVQWPQNTTGRRLLYIQLNGTTIIGRSETAPSSSNASNTLDQIVTTTYQMSVGDYVELLAYQDSGGSLTISASGNWTPEFMMARIDSGGQGFVPIPMVKTANYTCTQSDAMVVAGANSLTITLPACSGRAPGMPLVISNDNFTPTTIAVSGSDTIRGTSSYSLVGAYTSVTIVGDGVSVWRLI